MFRAPSPNPQPHWKRPIYLFSTAILGAMLAVLGEIMWSVFADTTVSLSGPLIRFDALSIILVVVVAVGGFFVGRVWWQMVYIERRWGGIHSPPKHQHAPDPTVTH